MESCDDDNDGEDVLFPDRWLSSLVLCCVFCGPDVPLFCVCLAVPTAVRLFASRLVSYVSVDFLDSRVCRPSAAQL